MSIPETVRQEVLTLYQEVDRAVAAVGPVCLASGRCCRFLDYGHILFLSNLEAEILLADAPDDASAAGPGDCPFQKNNLCTAREQRPLACRIYYCDPAYQDTSEEITDWSLRRLKALADEQGVEWQYAPLHVFLNSPRPASANGSASSDR